MIAKKPTILIYTVRPDAALLRELCAGMEEEGVLYELVPATVGELSVLARAASLSSTLGTGLALCERSAALYTRGAPDSVPVLLRENMTEDVARALGQSAARLIKKMPLKFN